MFDSTAIALGMNLPWKITTTSKAMSKEVTNKIVKEVHPIYITNTPYKSGISSVSYSFIMIDNVSSTIATLVDVLNHHPSPASVIHCMQGFLNDLILLIDTWSRKVY